MMDMDKRLSVIIPVYNEECSIREAIRFFENFVETNPSAEVFFVNDGSTDKTSSFLDTIQNNKIKVINQSKNKGYGKALKTGIKRSSYEYIAITDADGSYPYERIPDLFSIFIEENADMLVGLREGEITKIDILRNFGKNILRKLAQYLSGEKIPDLNSGLRIVRKDLLLKLLRFFPDGFSFTSTLTLSFLANNCKIIYKPIRYRRRKGKSKINPFTAPLNFFQLILRTVMFFNPLKIFLPLGLLFILLACLVLITSFLSGKVMDITTILFFTTGLNFLAIGLLADLIDKRLH